ncbi:nicotinamide riboside transporter PnuC [Hugenholtzia roseola]|uniref:nicotinamide riboside transporter PnuC n=1 Tax=Hugenholtzia roseola TaxID=1002 RepID=UPI0003F8C6CE|nr:nicotinamide riboside transporter PnuC [Hugenholtzia roseola]
MYETLIASIKTYLARPESLEDFAALMGFICVLLNTRAHVLGWVFGIFSIIPYIYIFYQVGLYGDFSLHIFFLFANFYGLYHWLWGGQKAKIDSLPITKSKPTILLKSAVFALLGTILFGFITSNIQGVSYPYIDAYIAVFSIWGQILLAQKKIENWLLWIAVDVVAIWVYYHKDLKSTAFLYLIYLFMASYGYWHWHNKIKSYSV